MSNAPTIQWFPGHMAKTRRIIKESLRLVDVVVELLDARIPRASANPEMRSLVGAKPRVVLLNKADYADPDMTARWLTYFRERHRSALSADCRSGRGLNRFDATVREAMGEALARRQERGMAGAPIRLMIVGIPNVGKSSLINRLAGGKRAKVEDRPGVTRGKQWVTLSGGLDLLDMPGVLWPKFTDQEVAEHLAFVGAVKDHILDVEALAARLLETLAVRYPQRLCERYRLDGGDVQDPAAGGEALLELVAKKRGMLRPGGVADTERAAAAVLDEFRGGQIGRITLEKPGRNRDGE